MRLAILDSGHRVPMKGKLAVIRTVSRLPVPDAIQTNRYRPDFYGTPMGVLTQEAMRGPSAWSVGDRELMGASVSQINKCEVCTKTHAGVAALAYQDEAKVSAALADLETAPIKEPLRAAMRMLRKLTRDHARGPSRRRLTRADRGRARGLLHLQCRRSDVSNLRVGRAECQGLRGRVEIPAHARLPLSTAGSPVSIRIPELDCPPALPLRPHQAEELIFRSSGHR